MPPEAAAGVELHPAAAPAVEAWAKKPSLRAVYGGYYEAMARRVPEGGRILEIGAGTGHSRDFFKGRDVVRLDILPAPWIDIVADAHDLPLPPASVDAIVMLDVLHHLADPPKFFEGVERVLKPGGRCIMIDPAMSPIGWFFFSVFHPEPVDMSANPMVRQTYGETKDPYDSNQAIPALLFKKRIYRRQFEQKFPTLHIAETRTMSLVAYPLCGGFQPWSLISGGVAKALLKLELFLEPVLAPLMGFRLLVTLEKARGPKG